MPSLATAYWRRLPVKATPAAADFQASVLEPVTRQPAARVPARGRERWAINKLRTLNAWYTKGLDNGSHLRVAVNSCESVAHLGESIGEFFLAPVEARG